MGELDAYDYDLPEDRIALEPARPRDHARLLCAHRGPDFLDARVRDLPEHLRAGDVLVVNDTKVIQARLMGLRPGRAGGPDVAVEATVLMFGAGTFSALTKPGKRLKLGDDVVFAGGLVARVLAKDDGGVIHFRHDDRVDFLDHLARHGHMPLPPYIAAKRAERPDDRADYQTIFADQAGSVAAPTAGLHFTPDLLSALGAKEIAIEKVTLHVGAGTFLPVKTARLADHVMHGEWGSVTDQVADRLNAARAKGRGIVAIGTTSLRLLESAVTPQGIFNPFQDETRLFIRPGHKIASADLLFTNFHLPRSTLLMLLAAFAGMDRMRAGYDHALRGDYRFYSYGDASLWARVSS